MSSILACSECAHNRKVVINSEGAVGAVNQPCSAQQEILNPVTVTKLGFLQESQSFTIRKIYKCDLQHVLDPNLCISSDSLATNASETLPSLLMPD